MNPQIKKIFTDSGLFEESEDYEGLFFAQKLNYNAETDINNIIDRISDEMGRSIENWRDADNESEETEYHKGYHDACNDILEEFKERFK
jgi:cell division protein YceG involved in septum cleavage